MSPRYGLNLQCEGLSEMTKNFFSLGYNLADPIDLTLSALKINAHEYPSEDYDSELINISSWWTPAMATEIQCRFKVNVSEIRMQCALGKDDVLFLTVFTYCPGTKLQHQSKPVAISSEIVEFTLLIPENELAEDLNLHAVVTTQFNQDDDRKVGAPTLTNSRLLTKSWKIYLSGSRTQANVVSTDFSKNSQLSKAMWQIKINPSIDIDSWLVAQHSSVLRIQVNKKYEDFIHTPFFQIPMMTDLVMLALDSAISDPDKLAFLQSEASAQGSWAKFVKSMYLQIFNQGQLGVREKWLDEQEFYRARVQHLMSSNLEIK